MKTCSRCKKIKPDGDFYSMGKRLQGYCKPCHAEKGLEWARKNKDLINKRSRTKRQADPSINRNAELKTRYGITLEDYQRMLDEQDGTCAICQNETKATLSVDHCHETGMVRGLLCSKCNLGLGRFNDDLKLIKEAAKYLEEKNNG